MLNIVGKNNLRAIVGASGPEETSDGFASVVSHSIQSSSDTFVGALQSALVAYSTPDEVP